MKHVAYRFIKSWRLEARESTQLATERGEHKLKLKSSIICGVEMITFVPCPCLVIFSTNKTDFCSSEVIVDAM